MGNLHLVTGYRGQAHVTAADDGSLNAAIFGTGSYVLNRGGKCAANVVSANSIRIADGDIMFQGRHCRINEGTRVELAIDNGQNGKSRNDLIVCRYTRDTATGVEDVNILVIKGAAVDSSPVDPAYNQGNILTDHATIADFPLYRVPIVGLTVQPLVPLFSLLNIPTAVNGKHADENGAISLTAADVGALAKSGGTMTGAITTNGIILKQGVDYGDSLPGTVTPGKLFFKRVT